MTTKAKHRWRSHKTNGKIIFKSKGKAHKAKYLGNILGGKEKEVKEDQVEKRINEQQNLGSNIL